MIRKKSKIEVIRMDVISECWDAKLASFSPRIYYSWAWMQFILSFQNGEPLMLNIFHNDEEVGVFVGVLFKRFGIRILGAPMVGWTTPYMGLLVRPEYQELVPDIIDAVSKYTFSKLKCAHFEHRSHVVPKECYKQPNWVVNVSQGYQVNLARGKEEVFNSFYPACRRNIRKAMREGIFIEQVKDDSFAEDYYCQLIDVFTKQGKKPTYNISRVQNLIHYVETTGRLLLLKAIHSEHGCIATGIFPYDEQWIYFFGGASWRKHQIFRPNELIQWSAMEFAIKQGIKFYDMGGAGEYKAKYGGKPLIYVHARRSRNRLVGTLRDGMKLLLQAKQRRLWDGS